MHILFITDNFPPETNAPANRTFEHAKRWVCKNTKVTIITGVPNFPKGKIFKGYKNKIYQKEEIDGINVIRVWTFISSNEGFFLRTLDFMSFMVSSIVASIFVKRVDLVIGTSPQFFTVIAARLVSLIKRKPWVFELRDLWPESIEAVGLLKKSLIYKLLEWIEIKLYKNASLIISLTHSFKKDLIKRGISSKKIRVITNGVNLNKFSNRQKSQSLLKKLNIGNCFIFGYIGTHGIAHNLETILYAAKETKNKNIKFLFIGDGAKKRDLMKEAKMLNLSNVLFIDNVSRDEIQKYWSIIDVSIIHLKKNKTFESVIPSKIFESMAMGIPVLHGVPGESSKIVIENSTGEVFESENVSDLVEKIKLISSEYKKFQTFQSNSIKASKNYDRNVLADKMLDILKEIS